MLRKALTARSGSSCLLTLRLPAWDTVQRTLCSTSPTAGSFRCRFSTERLPPAPGVSQVVSGGDQTSTGATDAHRADELVPPEEPGPEDCCQNSCIECVWEQYWRQLKAYNDEVARRRGEAPARDPFQDLEERLARQAAARQN